MKRRTIRRAGLATLAAAALLSGCHRPISDPARLQELGAAAGSLRVTHPADAARHYSEVPKSEWPAAIANLHPERVVVHEWGVDVVIKSYFDGGWGYHVAEQRRDLPMLDGCYSEISKGVFWHGPC
ncbi:hypothetical protein ACG3SL_16815 [Sphingomonas sp. CJ20]